MTHIGWILLGTYLLWPTYIAAMQLLRARDEGRLGAVASKLAIPIIVAGYALDVAVNATFFTALFLEAPHELTVTDRLKRHIADNTWRGRIARWFARELLDTFDPSGRHI